MVCPKCGTSTDGYNFCPKCGTNVLVRAPKKRNTVTPVQKKLKSVRVPTNPAKANVSLFFTIMSGVSLVYPLFVYICVLANSPEMRLFGSSVNKHAFYMTWLNIITVGLFFGAAFAIAGLTKAVKYEKEYEEYTARVRAARTLSTIILYISMIVVFIMAFFLIREYVIRVIN